MSHDAPRVSSPTGTDDGNIDDYDGRDPNEPAEEPHTATASLRDDDDDADDVEDADLGATSGEMDGSVNIDSNPPSSLRSRRRMDGGHEWVVIDDILESDDGEQGGEHSPNDRTASSPAAALDGDDDDVERDEGASYYRVEAVDGRGRSRGRTAVDDDDLLSAMMLLEYGGMAEPTNVSITGSSANLDGAAFVRDGPDTGEAAGGEPRSDSLVTQVATAGVSPGTAAAVRPAGSKPTGGRSKGGETSVVVAPKPSTVRAFRANEVVQWVNISDYLKTSIRKTQSWFPTTFHFLLLVVLFSHSMINLRSTDGTSTCSGLLNTAVTDEVITQCAAPTSTTDTSRMSRFVSSPAGVTDAVPCVEAFLRFLAKQGTWDTTSTANTASSRISGADSIFIGQASLRIATSLTIPLSTLSIRFQPVVSHLDSALLSAQLGEGSIRVLGTPSASPISRPAINPTLYRTSLAKYGSPPPDGSVYLGSSLDSRSGGANLDRHTSAQDDFNPVMAFDFPVSAASATDVVGSVITDLRRAVTSLAPIIRIIAAEAVSVSTQARGLVTAVSLVYEARMDDTVEPSLSVSCLTTPIATFLGPFGSNEGDRVGDWPVRNIFALVADVFLAVSCFVILWEIVASIRLEWRIYFDASASMSDTGGDGWDDRDGHTPVPRSPMSDSGSPPGTSPRESSAPRMHVLSSVARLGRSVDFWHVADFVIVGLLTAFVALRVNTWIVAHAFVNDILQSSTPAAQITSRAFQMTDAFEQTATVGAWLVVLLTLRVLKYIRFLSRLSFIYQSVNAAAQDLLGVVLISVAVISSFAFAAPFVFHSSDALQATSQGIYFLFFAILNGEPDGFRQLQSNDYVSPIVFFAMEFMLVWFLMLNVIVGVIAIGFGCTQDLEMIRRRQSWSLRRIFRDMGKYFKRALWSKSSSMLTGSTKPHSAVDGRSPEREEPSHRQPPGPPATADAPNTKTISVQDNSREKVEKLAAANAVPPAADDPDMPATMHAAKKQGVSFKAAVHIARLATALGGRHNSSVPPAPNAKPPARDQETYLEMRLRLLKLVQIWNDQGAPENFLSGPGFVTFKRFNALTRRSFPDAFIRTVFERAIQLSGCENGYDAKMRWLTVVVNRGIQLRQQLSRQRALVDAIFKRVVTQQRSDLHGGDGKLGGAAVGGDSGDAMIIVPKLLRHSQIRTLTETQRWHLEGRLISLWSSKATRIHTVLHAIMGDLQRGTASLSASALSPRKPAPPIFGADGGAATVVAVTPRRPRAGTAGPGSLPGKAVAFLDDVKAVQTVTSSPFSVSKGRGPRRLSVVTRVQVAGSRRRPGDPDDAPWGAPRLPRSSDDDDASSSSSSGSNDDHDGVDPAAASPMRTHDSPHRSQEKKLRRRLRSSNRLAVVPEWVTKISALETSARQSNEGWLADEMDVICYESRDRLQQLSNEESGRLLLIHGRMVGADDIVQRAQQRRKDEIAERRRLESLIAERARQARVRLAADAAGGGMSSDDEFGSDGRHSVVIPAGYVQSSERLASPPANAGSSTGTHHHRPQVLRGPGGTVVLALNVVEDGFPNITPIARQESQLESMRQENRSSARRSRVYAPAASRDGTNTPPTAAAALSGRSPLRSRSPPPRDRKRHPSHHHRDPHQ